MKKNLLNQMLKESAGYS